MPNKPHLKHKSPQAHVQMTQLEYSSLRSGPLPEAQQLEHYERIEPGAANRILTLVENQSAHRQAMEKEVVSSNSRDSLLGIISAFGLGLATIICGTIVILSGHGIYGTLLGGAGLTGLVTAFIYGTRSSRKERAEKDRQ